MLVHVMFGDSPIGSMQYAIRKQRISKEEKVIGFSDLFSIGPLWKLPEEDGVINRINWLKKHIPVEPRDHYFDVEYKARFLQTIEEFRSIPFDAPIYLWCGDNSHEHTGMRLALSLLTEHQNIKIIHTTKIHQELYNTPEIKYYILHTGEVNPDQLIEMKEQLDSLPVLSVNEKLTLIEEWRPLADSQNVLRIKPNGKIHGVDVSHLDEFIIQKAKKLQRKNKSFIPAARLIGEVIGYLEEYIGDQFIEYRVRELINQGIFEFEGSLEGMRFYQIRLV